MRLIIDTHVHLYPCYNIKQALDNLRTNLGQLDGQAVCMAILTERFDCNFFADFKNVATGLFSAETEIRYLNDAILILESGYQDLYILPGRQVVTKERIEILSLTVDKPIEDGLDAVEVIERIRQEKGVPVISWAPGKWFFKRKKVVQDLVDTHQPGSLLIGDTTLRPTCWPTPRIMRRASQKGLTIISGSDPLPFSGEELLPGRYGVIVDGEFDGDNPAESIRSLLTQPGLMPTLVGRRGGLLSTLRRLYKNSRLK